MHKRYSIAEARHNLAAIVHELEAQQVIDQFHSHLQAGVDHLLVGLHRAHRALGVRQHGRMACMRRDPVAQQEGGHAQAGEPVGHGLDFVAGRVGVATATGPDQSAVDGSCRVTVVPTLTSLAMLIFPPCASISALAIDRPSPLPRCSLLRELSTR